MPCTPSCLHEKTLHSYYCAPDPEVRRGPVNAVTQEGVEGRGQPLSRSSSQAVSAMVGCKASWLGIGKDGKESEIMKSPSGSQDEAGPCVKWTHPLTTKSNTGQRRWPNLFFDDDFPQARSFQGGQRLIRADGTSNEGQTRVHTKCKVHAGLAMASPTPTNKETPSSTPSGPSARASSDSSAVAPVAEAPPTRGWLATLHDDIDPAHSDIPVVTCSFVSGLCDSVAFNASSVFVSMQTGACLSFCLSWGADLDDQGTHTHD